MTEADRTMAPDATDDGERGAYLEAILRTMRQPLLVLDGALTIETANRAFYAAFDADPRETEGHSFFGLGGGDWDIPELRSLLEEILPRDEEVDDLRVEHDFARIGRRVMMVNARRVVRDAAADRILVALEDVTERERARAALEAERDYAEKIVDASRDPLLILGSDLRVLSANETFYRAFDIEPGETLGRLVYDLGDGQWDIPRMRELLEHVLPNNESFDDFVIEHEFAGIGRRSMVLNARRIDHVDMILLAFEDLTERRRAAAERDSSEARPRAFVSASSDVVFRVSADWTELREIDGGDIPALCDAREGTWFDRAVHPDDRPTVRAKVAEATERRETVALEHRVLHDDGTIGWMWSRAVPMLDAQGAVVEWFGTAHDITARREAEAALRESEERQAFLLELSDALLPLSDPDRIEREACRLLAERLGLEGAFLVELDEAEGKARIAREFARGGAVSPAWEDGQGDVGWLVDLLHGDQFTHVADTQTPPPVPSAISPAAPPIRGGAVAGALRATQDTPRHWTPAEAELVREAAARVSAAVQTARAETALRESEARLAAIFESASVGLSQLEVSGRFLGVNEELCRILGRSRDELLALSLADVTHPDDLPATRDAVAQVIAGGAAEGGSAALDKRYLRPDGSVVAAHSRMTLLPGRGGEYGTLLVVTADLTERKRAEQAVRESEARFRQFGEASSDALWIRDAQTLEWEYLSPAFDRIYGVDRERALASRDIGFLMGLVLPEDRVRTRTAIEGLREADDVYEYRVRRPSDGEVRWLRNTGFRLTDHDGVVRRLGGITHDMTDEKHTADRMEVLVAELQHRTRNLIGVIRAMATRTLRSSGSLETFERRFGERLEALARVNGLLSRLDEGDRVSFDELLAAELRGHGAADEDGPGAQVILDGPRGVRLPSASVQTLALALHELLTNAAKYGALSRPEGRLSVAWRRTSEPDPRLHVEWREIGVSVEATTVEGPREGGYGRELIERALPYQLGAETVYELKPDGLSCLVSLPISHSAQEDST